MKKNFFYVIIIAIFITTPLIASDDLPTPSDTETTQKIKEGTTKVLSGLGNAASKVVDSVKNVATETKENIKEQQKLIIQNITGTWKFSLADESYIVKIKDNGTMQVIFNREDNRTITWSGTYTVDSLAINFDITEMSTRHFFTSQKQPEDKTWIIWYSFKNLAENQIKFTCSNFPENSYDIQAAKNTIYIKE